MPYMMNAPTRIALAALAAAFQNSDVPDGLKELHNTCVNDVDAALTILGLAGTSDGEDLVDLLGGPKGANVAVLGAFENLGKFMVQVNDRPNLFEVTVALRMFFGIRKLVLRA